jgi:hypothetical protein
MLVGMGKKMTHVENATVHHAILVNHPITRKNEEGFFAV